MSLTQDECFAPDLDEQSLPLSEGHWARLVVARLAETREENCAIGKDLLSKCHHQTPRDKAALHEAETKGVRHWTGEMAIPATGYWSLATPIVTN